MSIGGPLLLRVRVIPRARTNALSLDANGVLRVRLTAPPVEGAANRALVELLAERLELKLAAIEIVQGARGRDKVVAVRGCSQSELVARLGRCTGRNDVDKPERRG